MGTASQLGEKVSDVMETAEALAKAAGKKLNNVRSGAADAVHSVRSTVRHGAEAIDDFKSDAADKLESAAAHVEKHHLNRMPAGLRRAVRRYPGVSMIVATGCGFLAATVLRAMTHTCDPD